MLGDALRDSVRSIGERPNHWPNPPESFPIHEPKRSALLPTWSLDVFGLYWLIL